MPSLPLVWYHWWNSGPVVRIGLLRTSTLALPVNGKAVVSSFHISIWSSFASRILKWSARSRIWTTALTPTFSQSFAISWAMSGHAAKAGTTLSSIDQGLAVRQQPDALAVLLGEADAVEQLVGLVGLVLRVLLGILVAGEVGVQGAGTPWRASPRPRKTDSLIWSRLIAYESAIRKSWFAKSLPISGSALYEDWLNAITASAPPKVG